MTAPRAPLNDDQISDWEQWLMRGESLTESGIKDLCAQAREANALRSAFQWMEDNSTLHARVEILYVVDGYQVQVMHEDEITKLSEEYHGDTLRGAAVLAARSNQRGDEG